MSNQKRNNNKHQRQLIKAKSVTLGSMSIPDNDYVEAFMGVPEGDVNPKGRPLKIAVIKHTELVQLAKEGRFAIHPTLGINDSITIEAAETSVTFTATPSDDLLARGHFGEGPRLFQDKNSAGNSTLAVSNFDTHIPAGNGQYALCAPMSVNGSLLPVRDIELGNQTFHNYVAFDVDSRDPNVFGSIPFEFRFSRQLNPSETIRFRVHALKSNATTTSGSWHDLNSHSTTLVGSLDSSILGTANDVVGLRFELEASLSSPMIALNFAYGIPLDGVVITYNTRTMQFGLTDGDWRDIRGVVSTGQIAILGIQVWFEWSGTMQQNGTLVTVQRPAGTTGQQLLDREEIVALQSSRNQGYNGPLDHGFIGFLKPQDLAGYGGMQVQGSMAPWESIYGAYSAVTTAAGDSLPQINVKYQYIIGYYPDNRIVRPSEQVYDGMALSSAFAFMTSMQTLHPNHDHKKTIRAALKKAASATGSTAAFLTKYAPVAAKVAAMATAMI